MMTRSVSLLGLIKYEGLANSQASHTKPRCHLGRDSRKLEWVLKIAVNGCDPLGEHSSSQRDLGVKLGIFASSVLGHFEASMGRTWRHLVLPVVTATTHQVEISSKASFKNQVHTFRGDGGGVRAGSTLDLSMVRVLKGVGQFIPASTQSSVCPRS